MTQQNNPTHAEPDEVDEILTKLPQYNLGDDPITDESFTADETYAIYPELKEAKAALLAYFTARERPRLEKFIEYFTEHTPDAFYPLDPDEAARVRKLVEMHLQHTAVRFEDYELEAALQVKKGES